MTLRRRRHLLRLCLRLRARHRLIEHRIDVAFLAKHRIRRQI
jgi:hypothetical protein